MTLVLIPCGILVRERSALATLILDICVCLSGCLDVGPSFKMLLLRQFLSDWADILTWWSPTSEKLVINTDTGSGRRDVINDVIKCSHSNGYISATDRPIDFVFDPRVGFSGTADRMDVLPVSPNPRWRLLMTSSRNNRCRKFGAKYLGNEAR